MKRRLPLGQPGQTCSLLRRQIPPLPNPYTAPGTEQGCNFPWKPRKILKPVSHVQCSHSWSH